MSKKEIILLFDKFLCDELSNNELRQLTDALVLPENRDLFMDIMEVDDLIDFEEPKHINIEQWLENTQEKLKKKHSIGRIFSHWTLKYAAVILLIMGPILFFNSEDKVSKNILKTIDSAVTLELGNGEVEVISGSDDKTIKGMDGRIIGTRKGNRLNYAKLAPSAKIVFNKLTVPFGKTFNIVLSDGTVVHLNSGSSLKYPISFIAGKDREVVLSGEGYFEVSKDSANLFVVKTEGLDIIVLGTQFDVSAYPEDSTISTVLIDGSVALSLTGDKNEIDGPSILSPGYKATLVKGEQGILRETVNVENYIGWLKGKIICDHMPFKDILKVLERHYDISIINNNQLLDKKIFTATFDIENIEQVMASFQKNHYFRFSIKNNNLIID